MTNGGVSALAMDHPETIEDGIVTSENAEAEPLRDWKVDTGDIRADPSIAREILEFIESHGAMSVVMTDGIIGCPHQEGIDYEGKSD